jgi:hypothetical protein
MPDTKNRAAPKRASSSKSKPKTSRSKSKSTKSRSAGSSSAKPKRSNNGSTDNGPAAVDSVRHAVEDKAKTAGRSVGKAAGKAKVPLIAGGAALAGAAGGLALATRQDRRNNLIKAMRKPKIKLTSHDVAKAAKEVGNFSAQVGELASELQRAREQTGNGRHRSPVEVVLQGLTARR